MIHDKSERKFFLKGNLTDKMNLILTCWWKMIKNEPIRRWFKWTIIFKKFLGEISRQVIWNFNLSEKTIFKIDNARMWSFEIFIRWLIKFDWLNFFLSLRNYQNSPNSITLQIRRSYHQTMALHNKRLSLTNHQTGS